MALNKYQRQAAAKYREGVVGDMGGQLEIEGLRDLQKSLRNLTEDSRNDMKETHRKAGQIVVDGAARLVPVRSGALVASLRSAPTQRQGRVRVGSAAVPYAGPIHFGWPARNIKPNPFIYEVLDGRRQEVYALYSQRISELIFKYDLG
ncbi:Bacteriophage HK97-gp10, putative tail-component [uncultured Caudovirales phage]|uniref:Bacteriophage HK97-gp10, putative tail-component n=1 Tax=uncultured Caudovirales phage TaxID=2100421 RepID=A0A6J5NJ35_9CAUD|nr:Bacteriophage HK97-gp10, putative tail-component [uncultured Caudovirales phage]CAB4158817.1 Bacteriophage HK97-gp10, putative tail-component [uncultured Caudovirales phage]